jgi:hypothetical protein
MSSKPETLIQRGVIDALNASELCHVWRQQSGQVRARRGFVHLAPRGSSDVVGYLLDGSGRHLALEVKLPDEQPTDIQRATLARVAAAGGVAGVVTSVGEALSLVRGAVRPARGAA